MKILALLLATVLLFGDHIAFRGEFDKALFEAKKEQKDLFFVLLKGDAKELFVDLLSDSDVVEAVNRRFIGVVAHFESAHSYPIEMFYTQSFPAIFLISHKDESLLAKPLSGAISKSELLRAIGK